MGGRNAYQDRITWADVVEEMGNQLAVWHAQPHVRLRASLSNSSRIIVEVHYMPVGHTQGAAPAFTYQTVWEHRRQADGSSVILRALHEAEAAWNATPWLWPEHRRRKARGDG